MDSCSNLHPCLFLLLLLLLPPILASPESNSGLIAPALPQVPCFFIFGDSVVDNGNNNYRNTTSKVDYHPYGIDFPAGPTGRFNNGRNIADVIAELLGFDRYIPPFANVASEDVLRGVNYGSGGAGILDETGRNLGDVISLNEQLFNHEVVVSKIAELLGSKSAAKEHLSKCIYMVGMGNNDYLQNYFPKYYSSSTPYTPQQFAAILSRHYSKQLRKLYKLGARKVAVSAVGSLGCVPQEMADRNITASCVETSNTIAQIFDEKIKLLLKHLNNHFPDAKFVYTADADHPPQYGNITNLTVPCCLVSEDGACIEGTVPCSNRETYMFWDAYHPTEAANLIFGKNIYDLMSPLYATSSVNNL